MALPLHGRGLILPSIALPPAKGRAAAPFPDASGFLAQQQGSDAIWMFRVNQNQNLTPSALDDAQDVFPSDIGAFFLKDEKLHCADQDGNACEVALDLGKDMQWAMLLGNKTLFCSIPFIDWNVINAINLQQQLWFHQWHHQQMMMQQQQIIEDYKKSLPPPTQWP